MSVAPMDAPTKLDLRDSRQMVNLLMGKQQQVELALASQVTNGQIMREILESQSLILAALAAIHLTRVKSAAPLLVVPR